MNSLKLNKVKINREKNLTRLTKALKYEDTPDGAVKMVLGR